MKCPYCMEEIADNADYCSLCKSELVKQCPFCSEKIQANAIKCKHCGSMLNINHDQQTRQPIQNQEQPPAMQQSISPLPPEAAGWCWGGFFLTWIWAIGNSTWIGLLALVPVLNIIMMVVLGAKGREWAWKNKKWQSVEQFNSVQKKWSVAGGIIFVIGVVGIFIAIAIPQFSAYRTKSFNYAALSELRNIKTSLESKFADNQVYPNSIEDIGYNIQTDINVKCSMNSAGYVCVSAHKKGSMMYITDNKSETFNEQPYAPGDQVQVPYDLQLPDTAQTNAYNDNQSSSGQEQSDAQQPLNSNSDSVPTVVGQCTNATVNNIGTRFTDYSKPLTKQDVPGYLDDGLNMGTSIIFSNNIYLVSYDKVPEVAASKTGDKVKMCLESIPDNCPPGDTRGKIYSVTNLRTKKMFVLPDSSHGCGGP